MTIFTKWKKTSSAWSSKSLIRKLKGISCRKRGKCFLGFMVKPHTSDIRMTYDYIRVTYGWHTSIYEWHTNDIRVHTSAIRMTCEWHTDGMRFERKVKLSFFLKLFDNSLSKYLICEKIPCMQWLLWLRMGSGISFWCTFSVWFFHINASYLIIYQLTKFNVIFFL